MRRRDFMRLAGGVLAAGAAGAALGGCSGSQRAAGAPVKARSTLEPPSTAAPTTAVTTTTLVPGAPTAADWASLAKMLHGDLVLPTSAGYVTDAHGYNPLFDSTRPQAIAYVASAADVSTAVAFGREHGVPLSIRSGGHCYGGWSTGSGLVIDVSVLNAVSVDPAGRTVSAGAGTHLVDFYAGLAPHSLAVPGGSCPTVGLAGLTLGGGLGVLGRQFGLTCDNLVAADIVLASGDVVTASATSSSDLFWALRGAGAGNFGVVTTLHFAAHPIGELGLFTLVWQWADAARVIAAWQAWAPLAPDALWSNCLLFASQVTPSGYGPVARVTGVYVGSEPAVEAELQPFLSAVGSEPFTRFVGTAGYADTMMIEAGCESDSVAECHLPTENPAGILQRAPFAAKSDIMTRPASAAAISAMLAAVEARQASPVLSGGGIALDALGGAINRVPADATAFVHRDGLYVVQYGAGWPTGAAASVVAANQQWLGTVWESMRGFVSGQAYQNYADPSLPGWAKAYYGANLARLQQVKVKYDPEDVFKFAQSVPVGSD
jgi:FAD/FMN-containing dehydrogenase